MNQAHRWLFPTREKAMGLEARLAEGQTMHQMNDPGTSAHVSGFAAQNKSSTYLVSATGSGAAFDLK
jgi:hypothetical protein